jgi:hypothetical protein
VQLHAIAMSTCKPDELAVAPVTWSEEIVSVVL